MDHRTVLVAIAVALVLPASAVVDAQRAPANTRLDVRLGSCKATLESRSPWRRNADGTYSNRERQASLIPAGTRLRLPIVTRGPMRVRPNQLSFPLDARMLPLPKDGIFGELLAGGEVAGPVSAGIDTGKNIRRRVPSLFLDPATSYLYFTTVNPFVIDLNKNNKTKAQRTPPKKKPGKKHKIVNMGFALDPCDPAVFFGGVSVNIKGVTATLDGIGFSLAGKVLHKSAMPVWTGRTLRTGQPELKPYVQRGHFYAKGTVGVGIAKFISLSGTAAATIDLDPKRDGVWGFQEAMGLLKGQMPRRLPDFRLVLEGSKQLTMPMVRIPFARVVAGIDVTDPRRVKVQIAGDKSRGASLADLFPGTPPPGADLITAKGALQVFANATFDATSPRLNGSYQLKVRGTMELGPLRVEGDADISYRVGGLPQVCVKLPGMGRMCGKQIEDAFKGLAEKAVATALDGVRFYQNLGSELDKSFDDGLKVVGKSIKNAEHNLHGAPKCTRESRRLGKKTGTRFRERLTVRANVFFANVRPKIRHLPPEQRARAVRSAYNRFYKAALAKRAKINARGRNKVFGWSVNPNFGKQYQNAYSRSFDKHAGDVRATLAAVYAKPENVGLPLR